MWSTGLVSMWHLPSVLVLVSVLALGSASGLGLVLALIWAAVQAADVGASPASVVHLSASCLHVLRPPDRHPGSPLSFRISEPVLLQPPLLRPYP